MICHNTARSPSSGSLLTVGSQKAERQIVKPSAPANRSSTTWKPLKEGPEPWSSSSLVKNGCRNTDCRLMTKYITCSATDHILLTMHRTLPSSFSSVSPWSVTHTWLPVQNSPHKCQSITCNLVPCIEMSGTSSGPTELWHGRNYGDPRNSL